MWGDIKNFLKSNENESMTYQNLSVLRGIFIAMSTYIKKAKTTTTRSQIVA
jgi:hypothetical protein